MVRICVIFRRHTEPLPNIGMFLCRGNNRTAKMFAISWNKYLKMPQVNEHGVDEKSMPGRDQNHVLDAMRYVPLCPLFPTKRLFEATTIALIKSFDVNVSQYRKRDFWVEVCILLQLHCSAVGQAGSAVYPHLLRRCYHLTKYHVSVLGLLPRDGARVGRGAHGRLSTSRAGGGDAHHLLREEYEGQPPPSAAEISYSSLYLHICSLVLLLGHGTEVHQLLLEPEILRSFETDPDQADIIYQRTAARG